MSRHQAPALTFSAFRLIVVTMDPSEADLLEIVRDTGLTVPEFLEGDGYLSWGQVHRLTCNTLRINRHAGLALQAGLRGVPSIHGSMGIAAMTSGTLGEALGLFDKYMSTRSQMFVMKYEHDAGDFSSMSFDFLPEPDAALCFLMEAVMASAFSCTEFLLGQPMTGAEVHFTFARPPHADEFDKAFHGSVIRFDAARNAVLIPQTYTARPLISRDRQMQNMALQQCEAVHDDLRRKGSTAELVLSRLQRESGRLLTLEQLAEQLNLSRRTLLRRLKEEGTSYQHLLDTEVSRRAVFLMSLPGSTVAAVAAELGYAEPVSFRRAFRRWFGVTPTEYRHSH